MARPTPRGGLGRAGLGGIIGRGMAKPKITTTMLEEYLRQMPSRSFGVLPWWVIIFAGGIPPILGYVVFQGFGYAAVGLVLGWVVYKALSSFRARQEARLRPEARLDYEKWGQVDRLKKCMGEGKLSSHVPGPVLEQLEVAARARFEALEDLRLQSGHAPELALQVREDLDSELALAISCAAPVIRREEHGYSQVKKWEADEPLMQSVCRRVASRSERLATIAASVHGLGPLSDGSLREQLAKVREERLAAEAELEASLREV